MGQAKRRGSKEQRIADAQNRKLEQLGVNEVNIAKLLADQGLPDDCEMLGYIIYLEERDEFLAAFEDDELATRASYAKTPEHALRIHDMNEVLRISQWVGKKHDVTVSLLFDCDSMGQYIVLPSFKPNE